MALSKTEVVEALCAANKASWMPKPAGGCGRAYVCVQGTKEEIRFVAAACKDLGLMFLKKAYGTGGNAIYLGYDNADGRALGRADAFAATLNGLGVRCYADAVGD